jgi:hypothetical protein
MKQMVKRYFGEEYMDNKITIEFEDGLAVTFWDNHIYIGTKITFYQDFELPGNTYRRVLPKF